MLPAQGWLAESKNTNQDPATARLPLEYSGRYYEGGDGTIVGATELDFSQVSVIFVRSFIVERFGYGKSQVGTNWVRILTIDLVQAQAFGVVLLDSFTPPAVANEFFEFAAYTQLACVGGEDGENSSFGSCMLSEYTPTFEETSSPLTPVFTE